MSYRVPVIGETWRARKLPAFITVHIDDLSEDDSGNAFVEFTATTRVGSAVRESTRRVLLNLFVHNYELAPAESPNDPAVAEVEPDDRSDVGLDLTLDVDGAA